MTTNTWLEQDGGWSIYTDRGYGGIDHVPDDGYIWCANSDGTSKYYQCGCCVTLEDAKKTVEMWLGINTDKESGA